MIFLAKIPNGIILVLDEWKNVAKQEILGSILITSKGELLIWKAKDVTGEPKKWENIIRMIESFFDMFKTENIQIIGLVTDSASQYAATK